MIVGVSIETQILLPVLHENIGLRLTGKIKRVSKR